MCAFLYCRTRPTIQSHCCAAPSPINQLRDHRPIESTQINQLHQFTPKFKFKSLQSTTPKFIQTDQPKPFETKSNHIDQSDPSKPIHQKPSTFTLLVVANEPPLEPTTRQPVAIAVPKEVPPVPTTGKRQSLAAAKA